MLSRLLVTAVLGVITLCAQNGAVSPGAVIFPAPQVSFKELQDFLSLTDQQIDSLRSLQAEKDTALQAIFKQLAEKQTELSNLLQSGSTDYTRIGQLTVEINNGQKQYPGPTEPYRSQALAVLNPQQKAKLPALAAALTLNTPAYQAIGLNLFDPPLSSPPRIYLPAAAK